MKCGKYTWYMSFGVASVEYLIEAYSIEMRLKNLNKLVGNWKIILTHTSENWDIMFYIKKKIKVCAGTAKTK